MSSEQSMELSGKKKRACVNIGIGRFISKDLLR